MPDELTDRQQDAIEPLLAIADEAGGHWPQRIRVAAVKLFQLVEDQNTGVQILGDIRAIFDSLAEDKISSADLLEKLKEIETSPWADWSKGKGLTANGLSRLLKPFGIGPRTIRLEDKTPKGYSRDSFEDAFSRYLSSQASVSPFEPQHRHKPCLARVVALWRIKRGIETVRTETSLPGPYLPAQSVACLLCTAKRTAVLPV